MKRSPLVSVTEILLLAYMLAYVTAQSSSTETTVEDLTPTTAESSSVLKSNLIGPIIDDLNLNDVRSLKKQVRKTEDWIRELQRDVATNKSQLNQYLEELKSLKPGVSELKESLDKLNKRLVTVTAQLEAAEAERKDCEAPLERMHNAEIRKLINERFDHDRKSLNYQPSWYYLNYINLLHRLRTKIEDEKLQLSLLQN